MGGFLSANKKSHRDKGSLALRNITKNFDNGFYCNSYINSNNLILVDSVQPRNLELLGIF